MSPEAAAEEKVDRESRILDAVLTLLSRHGISGVWDFYFETADLDDAERQSVRYIDEVLQRQDIGLVESVQRGMSTPAFDQGRIVCDPAGSGLSEHGVHHFHGLVLDAYRTLSRRA